MHLRAEADNAGKSYRDLEHLFVLANLEFTLLHEFGHALIDDLQLPVFGMEEDAADRIAIIAMLGVRRYEPEQQMIPWLLAVATDWYTEWELRDRLRTGAAYWDNHRLEIQRFHNVVCLVYGSNPEVFDDLMDTRFLPFERAVNCEYEYKQAQRALRWASEQHGYKAGETPDADRVKVSYKTPNNALGKMLLGWVQSSGMVETRARQMATRFRFPRPISIDFENCGSSSDAYWHQPTATITVCYELLGHFLKMAKYPLNNPDRACQIPLVRVYLSERLGCPEEQSKTGEKMDNKTEQEVEQKTGR